MCNNQNLFLKHKEREMKFLSESIKQFVSNVLTSLWKGNPKNFKQQLEHTTQSSGPPPAWIKRRKR